MAKVMCVYDKYVDYEDCRHRVEVFLIGGKTFKVVETFDHFLECDEDVVIQEFKYLDEVEGYLRKIKFPVEW